MDMESECSILESVEDNEAIGSSENLDNIGESISKVENNNGSCVVEHDKQLGDDDVKGRAVEVTEPVTLPPVVGTADGSGLGLVSGSSSPETTMMKGRGLRKWRRIKREVTKDGVVSVDSSKLLKRGLSIAGVQSGKATQYYAEMKQKSEGSVSSTNAMMRSLGAAEDGFPMVGDSGLVMGPIFAAGTDSENSEDRSSKSSKSVSGPNMRYEGAVFVGQLRDKNRMKSLSGKNLGSSVQRVQQGKVQMETSKKPRGERFKIEKENSHSSMESDSRSSNFVFVQGINSLTSNGRQNGRSMNYDGENSDEAQGIEGQVGEELQTGYGRRNDGDFEDVSQGDLAAGSSWGVKEENSENQGCSTDLDPLAESIHLLQSAQEALEKEIQEYRVIGKEDILVDDSDQNSHFPSEFKSVGLEDHVPSSLEQLHSGDHVPHSLHALKSEINSLKENINVLESKLDETTAMLKVKESRVVELEAISSSRSLEEGPGSAIESNLGNDRDIESELETLFRLKIEAEVEYLAISRIIHNLRVLSVDQISVLEEQKKLASEQSQMLNKLGNAESKAAKLKTEAEQLENYCEDIVSADETLKLQNSVCKYTSCFFIQLILLAVILGLFVLQLSPQSAGVVPT